MTENREKWLDVTKGIGIIFMVLGHSNAPDRLRLWIYGFHMPLFFILAGFMFNSSKWKKRGLGSLIKNRAKAYLIPYTKYFLINLIVFSFLELIRYKSKYSYKNIFYYIGAGIYSHDISMPNCAPLWFLTCLFVSYFFFWALLYFDKQKKQFIIVISYILLLLVVCKIENCFQITQLPWHIDVALIASVFMLMGHIFSDKRDYITHNNHRLTSIVLLFGVGTIVIMINGRINMVQNQYQNIVLFILGATLLSLCVMLSSFTLCQYQNRVICKLADLLAFWGQNTIVFIGYNYMINVFVRQFVKLMGIENIIIYSLIDNLCVLIIVSLIICVFNNIFHKTLMEKINE